MAGRRGSGQHVTRAVTPGLASSDGRRGAVFSPETSVPGAGTCARTALGTDPVQRRVGTVYGDAPPPLGGGGTRGSGGGTDTPRRPGAAPVHRPGCSHVRAAERTCTGASLRKPVRPVPTLTAAGDGGRGPAEPRSRDPETAPPAHH